jgi:hypothetical protein
MKKNICNLCGKEYEYAVTVRINPDGKKICIHDNISDETYFSSHEKKIKSKLPKGQKLIRGKDGISRVCEITK